MKSTRHVVALLFVLTMIANMLFGFAYLRAAYGTVDCPCSGFYRFSMTKNGDVYDCLAWTNDTAITKVSFWYWEGNGSQGDADVKHEGRPITWNGTYYVAADKLEAIGVWTGKARFEAECYCCWSEEVTVPWFENFAVTLLASTAATAIFIFRRKGILKTNAIRAP